MYLRAGAKFAFNPDFPRMSIDYVFHDFRAESGPARLGADDAFSEEPISHVRRHPTACIDDRHHDRVFRRQELSGDGHRAAYRYFRNRIVDQIKEGAVEPSLVCHDQRE